MGLRKEIVLAVRLGLDRGRKHNLPLFPAWIRGIACCFLLVSIPMRAQEETQIRYRTEANYLAHFASFVEWPPSAFPNTQAHLKLCMFGNEEFGNSILALTSELTPQGRHIDLTLLKPTDRYASCHILFIGREDSRRYKAILGQIRDLPVLTVGETNDFLGAGGIVNFVFGETLQIDINAGAANRAHLKIRSALESMARHVTNMPGATETSKPKP